MTPPPINLTQLRNGHHTDEEVLGDILLALIDIAEAALNAQDDLIEALEHYLEARYTRGRNEFYGGAVRVRALTETLARFTTDNPPPP